MIMILAKMTDYLPHYATASGEDNEYNKSDYTTIHYLPLQQMREYLLCVY